MSDVANNTLPAVEIASRTDPGRDPDKQVNEDAATFVDTTHGVLVVVCDGMGGHAGGKEASDLAIKTIVEIVQAAPGATPPGVALKRAIEEANARVWSMPTAEAGYRPGSTVVAALIHDAGAEIAHVGDSRIYLVHAGAISQVTKDHSMVQEMVDRNLIRAEDAAKHPDANKILRALGIAKEVEVELRPEPLAFVQGDVMVLCSDGLSDLVEPAEILQIASLPPAQAAGQLVDLANARGGHDNITATVVLMKSSASTREAPTVMKTMPLTAHMAPADQGSGPTGTLLSAPLTPPGTSPAAAPLPAAGAPPTPGAPGALPATAPTSIGAPAIPPAPPPAHARDSAHPKSRPAILAIGIVLAVVAVGIVGAIVWFAIRPQHHSVRLVDDPQRDAAANDDDDAGPPPAITAAPTLSNPAGTSTTVLKRSDGGGVWDPCAALRRARDRGDAGVDQITRLEERCRQAGGQP